MKIISLICVILLICTSGCLKMFEEQKLVRIDDDDIVYADAKLMHSEGYLYTLPEKRSIARILIYHTKVKNMDIYAGHGKDDWRRIKQIVGAKESPVIINTAVYTDKIRILTKSVVTVGGYVEGIELYQSEISGEEN